MHCKTKQHITFSLSSNYYLLIAQMKIKENKLFAYLLAQNTIIQH